MSEPFTLVGENGPEMLRLPKGTTVHKSHRCEHGRLPEIEHCGQCNPGLTT